MISLYKIDLPPKNIIKSEKKFILSNITPVAIRRINDDLYSNLFLAYQSSIDKYIFFQLFLGVDPEDKITKTYLDDCSIGMNTIKAVKEKSDRYQRIIQNIAHDNSFNSSVDFEYDTEAGMYTFLGVRTITDRAAEVAEFYINTNNFLKMNLYIKALQNYNPTPDVYFVNKDFAEFDVIPINEIQHNATARCINKDTDHSFLFDHFTMKCGRHEYKMNFVHQERKENRDRVLTDCMLYDTYKELYEKHNLIKDLVFDVGDRYIFILYPVFNVIDNSLKSMKVLKISKDLIDHTNILDFERNIYVN